MHSRARRRWGLAAATGALLAFAAPAGAHDALSSLASWGDFGAAAPCLRVLSTAALACGRAAVAARRACYDAALDGASCDAPTLDAAVAAARAQALDAVSAGCDERQAAGLKASGVFDLLGDTARACRALESGVVEPAYAPVRDGAAVRAASDGERDCVTATARAAAKLGALAAATWQRTFDHIAGSALDAKQKDALAAHAAVRVGRARIAVGRMLAARCGAAQFAAVYGQSADNLLAAVAQAGSCFAEGAYQQSAVTCPQASAAASAATPCLNGSAGGYPCSNVDLLAYLPFNSIGGGQGNDVWGWTDALTGHEYAIMGRTSGASFVDVTTPTQPVYLGNLPPHTVNSTWRGIKVFHDHAFVISEAFGHGMQVFDLTQLRNVAAPPLTFTETAYYGGFSNCHTLALNEETGFAYAAGTNTCNGGLHMLDVHDPLHPTFAGCVSNDGYTHETECVVYRGPDAVYAGHELCFSSNTDTLTIADVSNKSAPVQVSRTGYSGLGYTHQGWLTDDQRYFLLDDELDELNFGHHTRTIIWDVYDLAAPTVLAQYFGPTTATDHNLYIAHGYLFEGNYRAGLRVLDLSGVAGGQLSEVGYFDIVPSSDAAGFAGAWSNYPFFASGTVLIGGIESGLFVVQPNLAPVATPTPLITATAAATRTVTSTRTVTPTRTPAPPPMLDPIAAPIVAGATAVLTGSGFTAGSRIIGFVGTSQGTQAIGPFTPRSWTPTQLMWDVPASLLLGQGFAIVAVVNTDQGYVGTQYERAFLYANAALNRPTILGIDGGALHEPDGALPVVYVSTPVHPGTTMTVTGSGFNNAAVNFFTAAGNLGPLWPQPGATATQLQVDIPANAPLGLAAVEIINSPYSGYVGSQTVFVPIGDPPTISGVAQTGGTIAVAGTGFAGGAVVNFFNRQPDGSVLNLGGPGLAGTVVSAAELRIAVPAGAVAGPSYVQIVNPPFIAFTSTGNDTDGGFMLVAP